MSSLSRVTFGYRPRRPVLTALDWDIRCGRTLMLGPNGAGKSTVLQLLAGLLRPQAGECRGYTGSDVGYLPQAVKALAGMTVLDQVAYCGWLKGLGTRAARERGRAVLAAVGLDARERDPASSLSGGQLRRVGLAQALIGDSKLLLLDEPTAGLDPAQRERFGEVLRAVTVPVVVATHQIEDVERSYDHVVVLDAGSLVFEGTVAQFLQRDPDGAGRPNGAYRAVLGTAGDT